MNNIYNPDINNTRYTNIIGFEKPSTNVVPIYAEYNTKLILPNNNAVKYFLKSILNNPAAIFTANAGVNGIAIINNIFPVDIFLNTFIYCSTFSFFFEYSITCFDNLFLNIEYDNRLPNTVNIHERMNPQNGPNIIKFTDINTSNGIIGIIDSIVRIKHDKRTPKSPVECINCTMLFTNSSII